MSVDHEAECDAIGPVISGVALTKLVWGGCGGNADNFGAEAECIDACVP